MCALPGKCESLCFVYVLIEPNLTNTESTHTHTHHVVDGHLLAREAQATNQKQQTPTKQKTKKKQQEACNTRARKCERCVELLLLLFHVGRALECCSRRCLCDRWRCAGDTWPQLGALLAHGAGDGGTLHFTLGVDNHAGIVCRRARREREREREGGREWNRGKA